MRMVSSPMGVRYMNSWAMLPPMMPTSAPTAMAGIPHRAKILKYALWSVLYCWSRPLSSLSRLYASFMVNSRARIRPARGRGSSRNLVWIWYTSLGNLLVRVHLARRKPGDDLLVRHRQDHLPISSVTKPYQLLSRRSVPARPLPHISGLHHGHR